MQIFKQSESTAARRYFYLHLVDASDGMTPETAEAAGQPQISKNGNGFGNTSAVLVAMGNGAYYVALTADELNTLGAIMVRYKSENTAEFQDVAYVVAYDPYDADNLGLGHLASIKDKTDNLPSDPADESLLEEAIVAAHAATDAIVNAVKDKTDNLPSDPASESGALAKDSTVAREETIAALALLVAAIQAQVNLIPADIGDVPTGIELNTEHGAGKYDQAGGMGGYVVSGGDLIWRMDEKLLLLKTAKETLEAVNAIARSLPEGAVANIDIEVGRLLEAVNSAIALIISSASDLKHLDVKTISGKDIMDNLDELKEDAGDIKKIVTMGLSDDRLEELANEEDDTDRNKQKN